MYKKNTKIPYFAAYGVSTRNTWWPEADETSGQNIMRLPCRAIRAKIGKPINVTWYSHFLMYNIILPSILRSLKWSPLIRFVDELRTHYLHVMSIPLDLIQVNKQTVRVKPLTTSQRKPMLDSKRHCLQRNGKNAAGASKRLYNLHWRRFGVHNTSGRSQISNFCNFVGGGELWRC